MKRFLLLTFSVFLVSVLSARTVTMQNHVTGPHYILGTDTLELYDTLGNKINNSTIKIQSSDPSVDLMVGHIWVKNTTATLMPNVYVKRTVNQEVTGSTNSFCFGINCYPPWVNESAIPTEIAAGDTDKSFYADYNPEGSGGLTSVTFEFFDNVTFGTRVSAMATIEFAISATGINDNKLVFNGPFPNPASQYANFEYNLPVTSKNARLLIRNMLGVEIDNVKIDSRSGKKSIDVSSYAPGIYFYSFIVDGKVIQSKKLIVKR